MKQKQICKIFILSISILTLIGCSTTKNNKEENIEFENFIKPKARNKATVGDFEKFLVYKKEQKRLSLLQQPILKVNKVYVYQGPKKITFCIFSEDENEYMARAYRTDRVFLTEQKDGIIKLKQPITLEFLGNFELKNSIIKISRNDRALSGKEWNECDLGYIKNDTIRLTENYNTKKYKYTKKWLAKTHKTNFKFIYQPDLIVTKHDGDKTHNPYYLIEGSFNAEINLEEEKMLRLLEKEKF